MAWGRQGYLSARNLKKLQWLPGVSVPEKKKKVHWILSHPIAYESSTVSTVHYESYLQNALAPGKGRGPETDTNNNAKSLMPLLFNYNESTHVGNNNNDVFE